MSKSKLVFSLWTIALITACASPTTIENPYIAENAPEDCSFQTDDFELYEVIESMSAKALKDWPGAKARYKSGLPEKHSLFVTIFISDDRGGSEYVFLAVDGISGNEIAGRLWSQIGTVEGYQFGDNLKVKESQIKDWLITKPDGSEDGNLIGKYMDTLNQCKLQND